MSVAVVQTAAGSPGSTGNSATATLTSSPTAGNILLAFFAYSQFGATRTASPPSVSWTQVDNSTLSNDSLAVYWYAVQSGDGTSWTFTMSGTAEWCSLVLYEISGASVSAPINQHGISSSGGASTVTSPSATPSVLSTLAVAGVTTDASTTVSSVSSGWTADRSAVTSFHATHGASRTALTSDTTTAISVTWTLNTGSSNSVQAIVLISPPIASGTAMRRTLSRLGTRTGSRQQRR